MKNGYHCLGRQNQQPLVVRTEEGLEAVGQVVGLQWNRRFYLNYVSEGLEGNMVLDCKGDRGVPLVRRGFLQLTSGEPGAYPELVYVQHLELTPDCLAVTTIGVVHKGLRYQNAD